MKILLVDDDKDSRAAISWFLRDQLHEVSECSDAEEALVLAKSEDYPMVLTDIHMPGMSGIDLLQAISSMPDHWRTDVVLYTGYGDMKTAIQALRLGAYDYLLKPVDAQDLALVIERVAEHQALIRENRRLTKHLDDQVKAATQETQMELVRVRELLTQTKVGTVGFFSDAMRSTLEMAQKYHADGSLPVLIQGETGAGKEIIARIVHFGSAVEHTSAKPFVDINCAALTPSLFESELFGYEAGAFTGGAVRGQKGKLDVACGGTLFLDEIGELSLEMQAKLLRVIQEKEYYRVGGLKKIKADVRIICATNVDLLTRMETGAFRRDLYYRLKVGHILLPPLRNRREEILPLANLFLQEFSRQRNKKFQGISDTAAIALKQYSWRGNVRELKNAIEWIVFMHNEEEVSRSHVEQILYDNKEQVPVSKLQDSTHSLGDIILSMPPKGMSLKECNDIIVREVLAAHKGNQTATARYLGLSLRALCYRLKHIQKRAYC